MSIDGIMKSLSQRRSYLIIMVLVMMVLALGAWALEYFNESIQPAEVWLGVILSVLASGIFAVIHTVLVYFVFTDADRDERSKKVLPADIGAALLDVANSTSNYQIFVRTGRHYRAAILPVLESKASTDRAPCVTTVILLDLRDDSLVEQYAGYRKSTAFDKHLWNREYVRVSILATIIAVCRAHCRNPMLFSPKLFLSPRLSMFRIEGSPTELVVTTEDPKDPAVRLRAVHHELRAHLRELDLVRQGSKEIEVPGKLGNIRSGLAQTLGNPAWLNDELWEKAETAVGNESPYKR